MCLMCSGHFVAFDDVSWSRMPLKFVVLPHSRGKGCRLLRVYCSRAARGANGRHADL